MTGLGIPSPFPPMEAVEARELPDGGGAWQYEPKWDGFRCVALRDGDAVLLGSKAGRPLARYFPDVVETLLALGPRRFALDGELVVSVDGRLSFEELQLRLHPAASRVARLAAAHPATYVAFDLLVDERGTRVLERPLAERRARLERFFARHADPRRGLALSPATRSLEAARAWLRELGDGLDGVVAKRADAPYAPGERAMLKVKRRRTADCVVGGYRRASSGKGVGSLLLGLYDEEDGRLHHVGHASSLPRGEGARLARELAALARRAGGPRGFDGRAPGGPSRWTKGERSTAWTAVPPVLVCEVEYDHVTGRRFRHGTKFLRRRPDKAPAQCTFAQIETPRGAAAFALP